MFITCIGPNNWYMVGSLNTALTVQSWSHGCVMLMSPNKGEIAVHGSHFSGDIAVRMREVLARPWVVDHEPRTFKFVIILSSKLVPYEFPRSPGD